MQTIKDNLISSLGETTATELANKIDLFFDKSLMKRAPFAYWL